MPTFLLLLDIALFVAMRFITGVVLGLVAAMLTILMIS